MPWVEIEQPCLSDICRIRIRRVCAPLVALCLPSVTLQETDDFFNRPDVT